MMICIVRIRYPVSVRELWRVLSVSNISGRIAKAARPLEKEQ